MANYSIIVPGGLNTDITGLGVAKLLSPGELTLGGRLKIGPGGKSRNMAQMAAAYLGPGKVAMIGRTSRDPFGLWEIPMRSLQEAGVDTSQVKIVSFKESGNKYPGIALIPVDQRGKNQIYVLPGVNEDFSPEDVEKAKALFENHRQKKIMILALEIPPGTAKYCIEKAAQNGIRVILDPGGISDSIDEMLSEKIFFMKPNEHEAQILTGVAIRDFESAKAAAQQLLAKGIDNVLITHGANGAYLFNKNTQLHLPIPPVHASTTRDETGCGDQVTAIVAAGLAEGKDLIAASRLAIKAGTLQFHKAGIQPVSKEELLNIN